MLLLPLLCGALLGCTDITDTLPLPRPDLTITQAGTWCRLVRFTITSDTTVTPDYPDDGCAGSNAGLLARKLVGQPMQWSAASRTLTVPVRIENRSSYSITLPITMELSPSSGTKKVIIPLGTSNTKIIPLNADSTRANGTEVWLVGGTGLLGASDTSVVRSLTFQVDTPVVKGELWFVLKGEEVADTAKPSIPVPAVWPTTLPMILDPADSVNYFRTVYIVRFDDSTSGAGVNGFLSTFNGSVFGALKGTETDSAPDYLIETPDPGASIGAVDSLAAAMESYPGVRTVVIASAAGGIRSGRYPIDAGASTRSQWFSALPDTSTGPWLRIRAPQAWSCETGTYGSTPVKVGIIENAFDANNIPGDIQSSATAARVFEPTGPATSTPLTAPTADREHAEDVAATLTAQGDNGSNGTGMAWKTELYVFKRTIGVGSSARYASALPAFKEILERADSLNIRVLVIPVDWPGRRLSETRRAQSLVADFLRKNTDAVVIVSAGNGNKHRSLAQLRSDGSAHAWWGQGSQVLFWGLADLTDSAGIGDRVILVSGTDDNGTTESPSNVFSGMGAVAAPYSILGVHGVLAHGTSFAAPMVGGLAALLATYKPSLSGSQLASLIRTGATADRPNSSGALTARTAIESGSGVHEIDAFASLTQLSASSSALPICGLPVRPLTVGGQRVVLIERSGVADTLVPVQQSFYSYLWPREVSVAQGGRSVSTTGNVSPDATQTTDIFALSGGGWSRSTTSGYFMMHYLEKDTVYIRHVPTGGGAGVGRGDLYVRLNSGSDKQVTQNAPVGTIFGVWDAEIPTFSPTGDWISFMWLYATSCGTDNYDHFRRYVVSLRSSSELTQTTTIDWCANPNLPNGTEIAGGSGWHPDGVTLATVKSAIASTHSDEVFRFYSIESGSMTQVGSAASVSGSYPKGIRFESDPRRIRVGEELAGGSCRVNVRSASAPGTLLGFSDGCDVSPVLGPSAVVASGASAEATASTRYPSGTIAYLMRGRSVLKR